MPRTVTGHIALPAGANPDELTVELHVGPPGSGEVVKAPVAADGSFSVDVPDDVAAPPHPDAATVARHHPRLAAIFGLHAAEARLEKALDEGATGAAHLLKSARGEVDELRNKVADFVATAPHLAARAEGRPPAPGDANLTLRVVHQDDAGGPAQEHPLSLPAGASTLHVGSVGGVTPTADATQWEYDEAASLPRRKWGVQKLDEPTFDPDWQATYLNMLVNTNAPTVGKPYGFFVGNFLRQDQLAPYWSFKLTVMTTPGVAVVFESVEEAQAAFPENLTLQTKKAQGQAFLDDAFLVSRLLGGMYAPYFRTTTSGEQEVLTAPMSWEGYERDPQATYALNDVEVELRRPAGTEQLPVLSAITVAGQRYTPTGNTSSWDTWNWAKYQALVSYLLRGETDAHLTRGHLVVEQYLLPTMRQLSPDNPARQVMAPHLRDVWGINNFGDPLIFGETGVLARCSALTRNGVHARLRDVLGGLDWRGFAPRRPLCPEHRWARAAGLYWQGVKAHVDAWFAAHWAPASAADQARWRRELGAFSDDLVGHAVPWRATEPGDGWRDRSEFSSATGVDGAPRTGAVSPLDPTSLDEIKQLCAYAIFHGTFAHDWANDRQQDDGGDVLFASFGLREAAPCSDGNWAAWWERAKPEPAAAAFQLFLAQVLTNLKWGYVLGAPAMQARERADHAEHDETAQVKALLGVLQDDSHGPSLASQLAPLGLPLENLRARINT